jgi:D-sedoheptulose 7-phosphate isomerase
MDSLIRDMARKHFEESIAVKQKFLDDPEQMSTLVEVAKLCVETYKRGNKILIAGNGGSAADAQHFAGELVSRFNFDRPPLSAIALTTDTSILTAIGNDYGFDDIFARQLLAHGNVNDLFIAITTSGNSKNIIKAVSLAKEGAIKSIALTGNTGGDVARHADISIIVQSNSTPIIQECHIMIEHILCMIIEHIYFINIDKSL